MLKHPKINQLKNINNDNILENRLIFINSPMLSDKTQTKEDTLKTTYELVLYLINLKEHLPEENSNVKQKASYFAKMIINIINKEKSGMPPEEVINQICKLINAYNDKFPDWLKANFAKFIEYVIYLLKLQIVDPIELKNLVRKIILVFNVHEINISDQEEFNKLKKQFSIDKIVQEICRKLEMIYADITQSTNHSSGKIAQQMEFMEKAKNSLDQIINKQEIITLIEENKKKFANILLISLRKTIKNEKMSSDLTAYLTKTPEIEMKPVKLVDQKKTAPEPVINTTKTFQPNETTEMISINDLMDMDIEKNTSLSFASSNIVTLPIDQITQKQETILSDNIATSKNPQASTSLMRDDNIAEQNFQQIKQTKEEEDHYEEADFDISAYLDSEIFEINPKNNNNAKSKILNNDLFEITKDQIIPANSDLKSDKSEKVAEINEYLKEESSFSNSSENIAEEITDLEEADLSEYLEEIPEEESGFSNSSEIITEEITDLEEADLSKYLEEISDEGTVEGTDEETDLSEYLEEIPINQPNEAIINEIYERLTRNTKSQNKNDDNDYPTIELSISDLIQKQYSTESEISTNPLISVLQASDKNQEAKIANQTMEIGHELISAITAIAKQLIHENEIQIIKTKNLTHLFPSNLLQDLQKKIRVDKSNLLPSLNIPEISAIIINEFLSNKQYSAEIILSHIRQILTQEEDYLELINSLNNFSPSIIDWATINGIVLESYKETLKEHLLYPIVKSILINENLQNITIEDLVFEMRSKLSDQQTEDQAKLREYIKELEALDQNQKISDLTTKEFLMIHKQIIYVLTGEEIKISDIIEDIHEQRIIIPPKFQKFILQIITIIQKNYPQLPINEFIKKAAGIIGHFDLDYDEFIHEIGQLPNRTKIDKTQAIDIANKFLNEKITDKLIPWQKILKTKPHFTIKELEKRATDQKILSEIEQKLCRNISAISFTKEDNRHLILTFSSEALASMQKVIKQESATINDQKNLAILVTHFQKNKLPGGLAKTLRILLNISQ